MCVLVSGPDKLSPSTDTYAIKILYFILYG